jgi:hypothetical protein
MNIAAVEIEMRKCAKNCQATAMKSKASVSLMWHAGSHPWDCTISKEDCEVDSKVFLAVLAEARVMLLN